VSYFSWEFKDKDCDKEKNFVFQVDNNSDFSSPIINYTSPSLYLNSCANAKKTATNSQSPLVSLVPNPSSAPLVYGVKYYVQVKVFDSRGGDSGWVKLNDSTDSDKDGSAQTFTMLGHPAPTVGYLVSPDAETTSAKTPPVTVNFQDISKCYQKTAPYSFYCSSSSDTDYTWVFGDGGSNVKGSTSHTYNAKKIYQTYLTICDDGCLYPPCCCPSPGLAIPIGVQGSGSTPNWKEISPFK